MRSPEPYGSRPIHCDTGPNHLHTIGARRSEAALILTCQQTRFLDVEIDRPTRPASILARAAMKLGLRNDNLTSSWPVACRYRFLGRLLLSELVAVSPRTFSYYLP